MWNTSNQINCYHIQKMTLLNFFFENIYYQHFSLKILPLNWKFKSKKYTIKTKCYFTERKRVIISFYIFWAHGNEKSSKVSCENPGRALGFGFRCKYIASSYCSLLSKLKTIEHFLWYTFRPFMLEMGKKNHAKLRVVYYSFNIIHVLTSKGIKSFRSSFID